MSKQCIAMTLFLCESSVFSSRIRRRKREESAWVNNYTWRRVLQSALYNKLATICVSLLWRTFENKNSTAIYQPYTINVFLNWLHHVCYDTVGFLHFTTSFCSSLLYEKVKSFVLQKPNTLKWRWLCGYFVSIDVEKNNFWN